MPSITLLGWCHLLVSVVMIALSLPLILRWVPRNRWYGVRIRQSMADDRQWYRINYAGGWFLLFWATVLLVIALLMLILRPSLSQDMTLLLGLAPLVLLIAAWQTWRFARRQDVHPLSP